MNKKEELDYVRDEIAKAEKALKEKEEERKKEQARFPDLCENFGEPRYGVPIDERSPRLQKIHYASLRAYHAKIKPIEDKLKQLSEMERKLKLGIETDITSEKLSVEGTNYPLKKMPTIDKELLYPMIMNDLRDMYDTGKYNNWNEVYSKLAQLSLNKYKKYLKGKSLSAGQIKGIHTNKIKYTKDIK